MSENLYEAKTMSAWHEYVELGGKISFEKFYERNINVNLWVINLMRTVEDFDEFSIEYNVGGI